MKSPYVNQLSMGDGFSLKTSGALKGSLTHFAAPSVSGAGGPSFKNVMMKTVEGLNSTVNAPDKMMQEAITNGTYDVHDVMIASAKAELAVTIASQITTKVVQAYDKILQIQI
ncbi:MAG: flagellar hook-basal body complex protein FliE [Vampirovibrionales bacterium]|nr:flagellar hook-basal body complex protein FliE [Vampirovibrionales bacterium]